MLKLDKRREEQEMKNEIAKGMECLEKKFIKMKR